MSKQRQRRKKKSYKKGRKKAETGEIDQPSIRNKDSQV